MTGPGPGKLPIEAVVEIVIGSRTHVVEGAEVYLHVRGWSRAFVTHLDVESPKLNEVVAKPRQGFYARWRYLPAGLAIDCRRALTPCILRIREGGFLGSVFGVGEEDWCFVGGKVGGIFIGFRKGVIARLEDLAKRVWGVEPLPRRGASP